MVAKHVSSPTFSHFSLSVFLFVLISLSTFGIPCDADESTTQKPFIEEASDRFISRLSRLAQGGQDLGSKFGFRSSKRIRRASISSDTASPSVPSIVGSKRLANDKDEKEQFAIAKYSVPARLAKDFIDKWHETHVHPPSDSASSSSSEPIHFALAKAALDSSNFWEYGQWSSVSSWFDWSQEDTPQSWFKWVRDNDVEVDFWSLGAVTDPAKERRGKKGEDEKRDAEDKVDVKKKDGKKKRTAEVLSEFHVHPDDAPDFEDAFQQYASKTWEEEGNQVFGLRKVVTTNHHYWSYGAWDSLKDFRSHLLSKHAEALRNFAADRDIIWDLNPMITVGCDEDKPKSESRVHDEASKNRARFGMDEQDEDEDDDEEEEEGGKWDLKDFLGSRFGGKQ